MQSYGHFVMVVAWLAGKTLQTALDTVELILRIYLGEQHNEKQSTIG